MSPPRVLILGGSGFLSGTLAREAVAQGCETWVLTRGQRPVPDGVRPLVADRKDPEAFRAAVAAVPGMVPGAGFDLVVDCIAYDSTDIRQDMAAFAGRAKQFVFISTDFVYDPTKRKLPQPEADAHYVQENNYGGNKRRCELELINGNTENLAWTILRPCHIYGPGSLLGCSPPDNRDAGLLDKLRTGQTIPLVGGRLLQQPIFAPDLAKLILSVRGNARHRQIFNAAGPDMIESTDYYRIVADFLGVPLRVDDIPPGPYLQANPDKAPFLCHRIYDLSRLKAAGLTAPGTPVETGVRLHAQSLLG